MISKILLRTKLKLIDYVAQNDILYNIEIKKIQFRNLKN